MSKPSSQHALQAPTGTRDFYPAELNRLRYIQKAWREVSIRHGFEEIDGPTFEHLDLYTIKSGEGIVSELFSFERHGGEKTYALRPEFTPTLARMYAAKANALPKPTKWFWQQNCFRAERPQRGRLREFGQWNCDILGDDSPAADAELIGCCIAGLERLGLSPNDVRIEINDRRAVSRALFDAGVAPTDETRALNLLDRATKEPIEALRADFEELSIPTDLVRAITSKTGLFIPESDSSALELPAEVAKVAGPYLLPLFRELASMRLLPWCVLNTGVFRGLAYYTGMVFEVHEATGSERAIAGGGRYDALVGLFGGPPTPAVGFGMGDVVLSLVLQDKKLMPSDDEIAAELGLRPDIFIISSGSDAADAAVTPLVARLRREGLHARRSYKTTKNIGKLLKDAAAANARFAAIIEPDGVTATVKDLDMGEQGQPVALDQVGAAAIKR